MSKIVRRHWKPIAFLAQVLLFALIYQLVWIARPDYFRVQSDVNILPLDLVEQAQSFRDEAGRSLPISLNPDTHAAIQRIQAVYGEMRQSIETLRAMKAEFDRRERQDGRAYKAFEDSQWAQIDRYIQVRIEPYERQIAQLETQKRDILDSEGVKTEDALPAGGAAIRYTDLNLAQAKLRLAMSEVEAPARKYTLDHLTEFQTLPAQQAYLAFNRHTEALREALFRKQEQRWSLNGKLYDAFVDYRTASLPHLTYFDFLYFSIGGATTANSADIAPNHTIVRMLFSLEVLVSIVLVGLWVNELATPAKPLPVSVGEAVKAQ